MEIQLKDDRNNNDYNDSHPDVQEDLGAAIDMSKLILPLSMLVLGGLTYLGIQLVTNPAAMPWFYPRDGRSLPLASVNPPKTIAEINVELARSDLRLGEKLPININDSIYPVLLTRSNEIQEIRVYQPLTSTNGEEKFQLVRKIDITPPDEYFVRAPVFKYKTEQLKPGKANNQMPLTKLEPIEGTSPSRGIWFMATGKADNITYGQVFYYIAQPQPSLNWAIDWTSPASKSPQWQDFTDVSFTRNSPDSNSENAPQQDLPALVPNEPELVVERSQAFEPSLAVYSVEASRNPINPLQLREINLNEGLKMPKPYSDALLFASGGLWSSALQKLEAWKSELQSKGTAWSPFVQEQYQLIAWHAKALKEQADKTIADPGEQALVLALDGRWKAALDAASSSEITAKSTGEMLKLYGVHIWHRVNVALKLAPQSEVFTWGALIVLERDGLAAAQNWLQAQTGDVKNAIALLQKFDVSPLGIQPDRMLGTITSLGKTPGNGWLIPPPPLPAGQAWYAVNVTVIQDADTWRNSPFPSLAGRSPLFLWEALGMERNPSLSVSLPNTSGQNDLNYLTAHSLSVTGSGELRLLASGPEELTGLLNSSPLTAVVAGGNNAFVGANGVETSLSTVDEEIEDRIVRVIYGELQGLGSVSLEQEEFKQQLRSWSFQSVDITGDGQNDLLLELSRQQIDVGDRHYPMVIAFDSKGGLIFSDIAANARRRWIVLLPSQKPHQILTEIDGQLEVISLK
ncbi:hypothetical protein [Pseudanabaena sp. PCC 6802]|uniref:hypothetical protein n=1 Tax=Pseudanabaena sp. PCC 6802 TaxID=118173 RepID=UPI000349698D|nr:hypothetical protein [Pseudanabaena sp. PCC 6802]